MNNSSIVNTTYNSRFDSNTDCVFTCDDDTDCNNNIHSASKKT